ncbi:mechanosensitive ion channel family protein, partial [Cribrihabitans sp. XS_ASV171]
LFTYQATSISNFAETFGPLGLAQLFGFTLLALAAGFAAEKVVGLWTRRWIKNSPAGATVDLRGAAGFLFRRFCRELLGLVVFYYSLILIGRLLLTPEQITYAGPMVLYLIWFPRLGAALSRLILTPKRPELRLVNVDDHWAAY